MNTINRLTDTLDFHGQALQLRSLRQSMLASNIANADTPGFVARDFKFADALRMATSQVGPQGPASAGARASGGVQSQLAYAAASQNSIDNNTVDMDRERASFADNAVKYEATLRFINGHVKTMLEAIKGQ